jgi:hypothetical protein
MMHTISDMLVGTVDENKIMHLRICSTGQRIRRGSWENHTTQKQASGWGHLVERTGTEYNLYVSSRCEWFLCSSAVDLSKELDEGEPFI